MITSSKQNTTKRKVVHNMRKVEINVTFYYKFYTDKPYATESHYGISQDEFNKLCEKHEKRLKNDLYVSLRVEYERKEVYEYNA